MSGKPITPQGVANAKVSSIPGAVFDVFNGLIARSYHSGYATVRQKDVVKMLENRGYTSSQIFNNGWLNVETAYRQSGWNVRYDKPGYNESYDATFEFSKK